ncbi:hypothetical protein ACXHXM_34080
MKIYLLAIMIILHNVWRQMTVHNVLMFLPVLLIRLPIMLSLLLIGLIGETANKAYDYLVSAGYMPGLKWNYG